VSSDPATTVETAFREVAAEPRVESVGLSHLSIELGHLYLEDFEAGQAQLDEQFEIVAQKVLAARVPGSVGQPRISTCFLIDDYFARFSTPAEVVPMLLSAAQRHGLQIDYLARESGCATARGIPLAELVAGRLTALPPPDTNGSRPPVSESGWLCNGQRSPADGPREAMRRTDWAPPVEIGARNHSVFVDVELWRDGADSHDGRGKRLYSCAFLAAVWQLLRLGLLRNDGAGVVRPVPVGPSLPTSWDDLAPITALRPGASPFCAYRTFSVLPSRFLQVELAVRVILEQVAPQAEVLAQLSERADRDGMPFSSDVTRRVDYVFFNDS
jgi:hypothetical protein